MPPKDRPMTRLAVSLLPNGVERLDAGLCPMCGNTPDIFKDQLSKQEYEISGLCQGCQDEVFKV